VEYDGDVFAFWTTKTVVTVNHNNANAVSTDKLIYINNI